MQRSEAAKCQGERIRRPARKVGRCALLSSASKRGAVGGRPCGHPRSEDETLSTCGCPCASQGSWTKSLLKGPSNSKDAMKCRVRFQPFIRAPRPCNAMGNRARNAAAVRAGHSQWLQQGCARFSRAVLINNGIVGEEGTCC